MITRPRVRNAGSRMGGIRKTAGAVGNRTNRAPEEINITTTTTTTTEGQRDQEGTTHRMAEMATRRGSPDTVPPQ